MPSFDIVSEVDKTEVKNAVEQTNKKASNRFDFKGSDARAEQAEYVLTVYADGDFKLAKRGVDVRCLDLGKSEKASGNKVKRVTTVKLLKDSKLKVTASIQGERVWVRGAKRDVPREVIALMRKSITDFPLRYQNFRD